MGFPMSGNGKTRLTVYSGNYPGHTVVRKGDHEIYQINRDTKTLIIRSDRWTMPNATGDRGMMVQTLTGSGSLLGSPVYYDIRWVLSSS